MDRVAARDEHGDHAVTADLGVVPVEDALQALHVERRSGVARGGLRQRRRGLCQDVMQAMMFLTLLTFAPPARRERLSLDTLLVRRWPLWRFLCEPHAVDRRHGAPQLEPVEVGEMRFGTAPADPALFRARTGGHCTPSASHPLSHPRRVTAAPPGGVNAGHPRGLRRSGCGSARMARPCRPLMLPPGDISAQRANQCGSDRARASGGSDPSAVRMRLSRTQPNRLERRARPRRTRLGAEAADQVLGGRAGRGPLPAAPVRGPVAVRLRGRPALV